MVSISDSLGGITNISSTVQVNTIINKNNDEIIKVLILKNL